MTPKTKADLTLLKRLMSELENSLGTANSMSTDIDADLNEYVIELSKAAGLCSGIMQEASMLILDISQQVRHSQSPANSKSIDLLEKILSPLKGGGTGNDGGTN